jgi:hypothetical protein
MNAERSSTRLWSTWQVAGDIIFVYQDDPKSSKIRTGQRILRGWPWLKTPPARYSHVALVVDAGVVIHADGVKTLHQLTAEVLPEEPEGGHFRVVRWAKGLTDEEKSRLVTAAERFLEQPYTFLQIDRLIHRLVRGRRGLTLPFCSELVTTAYAAIGIPISKRAPQRTLPMDLDEACVSPRWRDVTDSFYYSSPISDPAWARYARTGDEMRLQLAKHRHTAFTIQSDLMAIMRSARPHMAKSTLQMAADPVGLIRRSPALARRTLERVGRIYDMIEGYPASFGLELSDGISKLFPHASESDRPYEGDVSIGEMKERTFEAKFEEYVDLLLSVTPLLEALAAARGLEGVPEGQGPALTRREAAELLQAMPELSESLAVELSARLDGMEQRMGPLATLTKTRQCIRLHAALSTLQRQDRHVDDGVEGR